MRIKKASAKMFFADLSFSQKMVPTTFLVIMHDVQQFLLCFLLHSLLPCFYGRFGAGWVCLGQMPCCGGRNPGAKEHKHLRGSCSFAVQPLPLSMLRAQQRQEDCIHVSQGSSVFICFSYLSRNSPVEFPCTMAMALVAEFFRGAFKAARSKQLT